nr:hypothetical protein [Tanacetum cinerariifolium]
MDGGIPEKSDRQKVVEYKSERAPAAKRKAQTARDKAIEKRSTVEGTSRRTEKKKGAPLTFAWMNPKEMILPAVVLEPIILLHLSIPSFRMMVTIRTTNVASFPQQYPCCEDCGGPHESFQCQPMNYFESNPCYDSNYFGFDQIEPPRYLVNPSLSIQNEPSDHELFISKLIQQKLQHEYAQHFSAIAYDLPTVEPEDYLRMGDGHLDTIPVTESDEFIKSSVENLVPNQSESDDLSDSECDVPACDDFTTFSNILFDDNDDFSSSDDESFSDEAISKKIYSNPLFDEEIISMKIDPRHFNAESDLIKSPLNHVPSIISSSSKIDSLLDEFAGELILLKTIPPGINETDCDPKEEIRLIEKLLYDNSSPQLLSNDSHSLPENESFYFDISSSSRPPVKPPHDDSGIMTVKVVDDISEHDVPMPRLLPT